MSKNEKGSTSAPTLSSRGSIIPQKETKMNSTKDNTSLTIAPVTSRRHFLTMAAAGSVAAALPPVAIASTDLKTSRLPPSLDQQFASCVDDLVSILKQMHPGTNVCKPFLRVDDDGAWQFSVFGKVKYIEFDGDGFYEISVFGVNSVWWLEKRFERSVRTGELLLNCEPYFLGTEWFNGSPVDDRPRRMYPKLVRKLDGAPA